MVDLQNCSFAEFNGRVQNKKFYCFGYGDQAKMFFSRHKNSGIVSYLKGIVDNNLSKAGQIVDVNGKKVKTLTFDEFSNMADKDSVLLLTSVYCVDMLKQSDAEPRLEGLETYISIFIDSVREESDFEFTRGPAKIPKKIHYCWFGGKPIPENLREYMRTWEKFCPDYEIIRWDESNYDVTKNEYMRQAYESKKWGFVPDYARLDIIYEHGGIYLDTDVEMIKPFDDLLNDEMFCGFEQSGCINFGNGFGAVKKNALIRELCDVYNDVSFINNDGSLNVTPCVYYQEPVLERFNVQFNGAYQNINGVVIYPSEVLDAENHWSKEMILTKSTRSLHHYASSWWGNPNMDAAAKKLRLSYRTLRQRMEENTYVQ